MKLVLQIVGSLRIGGAEKVARDIGLSLDPSEYEIHYIVFGNDVGEYESELISHGCKVLHWRSPSESYPDYLRSLRKLMRAKKYDVVHAHTMFNIGWAMFIARQCGVPIRISHAHSALSNGQNVKKDAYELCMRQLILRNATHLVACGNAAGVRLYGDMTYRKRGICILNGVDTFAFHYRPEAREKIRNSLHLEGAFVIGHVGHLTEVKNQSFLIRLMPEILRRQPRAKLLLLGEGEDRPKLEELILRLGLSDYVIMTGIVRNVSEHLSAMDVFAFPSLFEGMPLSVLEVQANGLPCVLSTNVPEDVFLTDLIYPVSLEAPEEWVDRICNSARKDAVHYATLLKEAGSDCSTTIRKITDLYH